MIIFKIGIPKDQIERLENLACRAGCDDVIDLIEKALAFTNNAVECIEDDGHIFFRYGDGSIACIRGLVPDVEDDSKPIPPLTPTSFGTEDIPKTSITLIDIIKRLGWEGLGLKIIRDSNS